MTVPRIAMLLAGAANLGPALFFLFTALLGSNGMNTTQGGRLLGSLALLRALAWVAAASSGTGAVYTVMALLAMFAMLLAVSA